METIELLVSWAVSVLLGWEFHRLWVKYREVWPEVKEFWGSGRARWTHIWRSILGRDPHDWTRRETLHGAERARGDGVFLGQGSVTYTWTCPCGQETDIEPYEGAGVEVSA